MRAAQQERMANLFGLILNERDPDAYLKLVSELLDLLNCVYSELILSRDSSSKARWAS